MNVDPSIILPSVESEYMLNAVVTHYGETTSRGHYITTLYRDGRFIDCNDEVVAPATNDPKMGYLFFMTESIMLLLPSLVSQLIIQMGSPHDYRTL